MGARARATILVVDDDPGIRDVLHLALDDEYEVVEAEDGVQALAILASRKIDLIVLDLLMAGADGFEVLEQRRAEDKAVPFIVLSALDTAATAATAMRLGAVDYVTKPFNEEALLCLIGETLSSPGGQARPGSRTEHSKTGRPLCRPRPRRLCERHGAPPTAVPGHARGKHL
jgi:DNA-binding NtrC family response regulator